MSDHTPTMARIEDMYAWAYAWRIEDGDEDTDLSAMRESQRAEFQRALAAHDREVAAEAWDEGYESATEFMTGPDWGASPQNPYRADRTTKETP